MQRRRIIMLSLMLALALVADAQRVLRGLVTAQESRGLATASKIEKHAMEHLQPSSFTDILELLPGGRAQNPSLTARLHKAWEHEAYHLGLSTNADYTGSFDNDKEDPDLNNQAEDAYSSQYNRMALMAALELKMKRQLWLKSVNVTLSAAYEHDHHPRMAPVTQEVIDKDDRPNATLKISYNADPNRYQELNPIIYQQLKNIAEQGPAAASMDKVKQYLVKQYAQLAIDDGYWDYVIWHELDDDADFDINYCQMVEQMTPQQVQQMARRMLEAQRRIEVTMLSGTPETALLHVGDMHCKKCADRIRSRLLAVKGIDSMEADVRRQNITVRFDGSQLTADSIRTLVTKAGYTPVRACKCGKGAYAYFLIPADQATQATVGTALAIKGVEDANASSLRKALAVKYHHQEITEEQLLSALRKAGISATLPKPHECKEEK